MRMPHLRGDLARDKNRIVYKTRTRRREESTAKVYSLVHVLTYLLTYLSAYSSIFLVRHLETPGCDLKRNYIPRVWERAGGMAAARSPKGSAKYDDTHGAATRRYSTSGGRMVDVDLRASQPASQAARILVTDLPQSAGKAGGCRLSSGVPGET